jgi:class 3 adenylate cyclase
MTDTLERGRDAVSRHDWEQGVVALTEADRDDGLSPDDLELLGTAAWWAARPDLAMETLERAFAGFEEADRAEDAARIALLLAYQASRRRAGSVAAGWVAQAKRLLEALPDSPWHAFIAVMEGQRAVFDGRIEEGITRLDEAMDLGRTLGNPDALYLAMSLKGMAEVMAGNWEAGLALMEEAATAATSGRLDLRAASDIQCITISSCRNVGDLQRAAQWAEESERWMRRNGAGGYPGICRVHRAELKMLRGDWPEAEQEAREACDELARFRLMDGVGFAYNAMGEIRLRMGDLDGATEAFDRAYEYGHDGQPGLSQLQLARGELAEAQRSISRALASASGPGALTDRAARGRLLPTQVDIALATGDLDTAERAVGELEAIAAEFDRPLYQAGAMTARGEVLLGEDRPSEASAILGQSWRLWQTTDLPYEAARARLHYAEALVAEGDEATARRDLLAARSVFERLGATLDRDHVDALLRGEPRGAATAASEQRLTRTFMFTDIVGSTELVGLIGDEAWGDLLGWHDRELRASFARHDGEVVSQTGDGFFVAFAEPTEAIDSAIDVQRRLALHRREHGFAPWVRIGLHTAQATRRGRDFSGRAVHLAARVGAAAEKDEILVTSSVLDGLSPSTFTVSQPRLLTLRGIREPVEARAVDWRLEHPPR